VTLRSVLIFGAVLGLAGCATDQHAANINCLSQPGCVSGFGDTGYGPVHAQAVAPDSATPRQPYP
jgi:hypothetical protein